MGRRYEDDQSRALYELSALVLNLLHSPPTPLTFSDHAPPAARRFPQPQISPSGFASLLLGVSLALMLCGSVTFFIGFMLMPWVLGLVMVFYVAGIVSSLTFVGRSILCYATAPPKDIAGALVVQNVCAWISPELNVDPLSMWKNLASLIPVELNMANSSFSIDIIAWKLL